MQRGVPYAFRTRWRVSSHIDAVWNAIQDAASYPRWWRSVLEVRLVDAGDARGIGRADAFVWRAPLGYRLRFVLRITDMEPPFRLGGDASGELEGRGDWTLKQEDAKHTLVQYDWNVRTRVGWMNAVAPLARPVFKRSHDAVMRDGANGLSRLLRATVVSLQSGEGR